MRLFSTILLSTILTACVNPEYERPWPDGPTYYKVPQCAEIQNYPREYRKFDHTTGVYDTYVTFDKISTTHCNYNPMTGIPQGNLSLIYLYGTYEE